MNKYRAIDAYRSVKRTLLIALDGIEYFLSSAMHCPHCSTRPEHNYGHGQQHLVSLLASLIILAFLVHTVLEWMDDHYRLLRQKLPSHQRLFNDLRTLTSYLCFERWDDLITFMLRRFEPERVVPVRLEPSRSLSNRRPRSPNWGKSPK